MEEIPGFESPTEIGRGGYGVVYRAHQPAFGRDVAIKVLHVATGGLDERARRRFDREMAITGQLSAHPHIVTLFHAGFTDRGRPYLVMAYQGGGSLGARIAGGVGLPWQEVVQIGIRLAGALATAHQAGIIHRDIKPDNILVDDFGAPVLSDFGIASVTGGGATQTATGQLAATIAFAAPEVLDGKRPGVEADVYGLAATLHALLTARPPFVRDDDASLATVVARMMREDPPDVRPLGVPDAVASVLERALRRDRGERTPTAVALGQALQAAQAAAGLPETAMVLPRNAVAGADDERTLALPDPDLLARLATTPQVDGATSPPDPSRTPTVPDAHDRTPEERQAAAGDGAQAATPTKPLPPAADLTSIPRDPTLLEVGPSPAHLPTYTPTNVDPSAGARAVAPRRRPGWAAVLLTLLLLAAVAVGALVVALRARDDGGPIPAATTEFASAPAEPTAASSAAAPAAATPTAPPPPTSTPVASETEAPAPTATPTSTPTAEPTPTPAESPTGPGQVAIESGHPDATAIASSFGTWASGINRAAYDEAFAVYTPALQTRVGFTTFAEGNATSAITRTQLLDVASDGGRRLAVIAFRSTQAAELGPDGQTCSDWELRWTMLADDSGRWLVDDVDALPGYPRACDT